MTVQRRYEPDAGTLDWGSGDSLPMTSTGNQGLDALADAIAERVFQRTQNVAGNWSGVPLRRRRAVIRQRLRCASAVRTHMHRQSRSSGGDATGVPHLNKLGGQR